eukprot:UN05063
MRSTKIIFSMSFFDVMYLPNPFVYEGTYFRVVFHFHYFLRLFLINGTSGVNSLVFNDFLGDCFYRLIWKHVRPLQSNQYLFNFG